MPAVVFRQREEPRSYDVQAQSGRVYRRNRKFLKEGPGFLKEEFQGEMDGAMKPEGREAEQEETEVLTQPEPLQEVENAYQEEPEQMLPRRSVREKRPPSYLNDYQVG